MNPTKEQVDEILERSGNGESVVRVIREMEADGLELYETLEYLKNNHGKAVKEAKRVYKEKVDKAEKEAKEEKDAKEEKAKVKEPK